MKFFFVAFYIILTFNSFSQSIKGKVLDENKIPLSGAILYYEGTTISTISDENGKFSLEYNPKENNTLVISFLGYQTQYFTNNDYFSSLDSDRNLNIYLRISGIPLKEVVINRKDKFSRKQKLEIFRKEFLGKTRNANAAIIKNEEDIYFKYDKTKFVLKAFSDKPLMIENRSLGYKIYYELINFEVTFSKLSIFNNDILLSSYKGLSRFEGIENSIQILTNREKAYRGSQIHFFSTLANNSWSKEHFLLANNKEKVYANDCFKINREENFIKVEVIKQLKKNKNENFVASYDVIFDEQEQTNIIFETNSFTVDKNGNNSNIENIIFTGAMSEKRVGDMLPLNYYSLPEKTSSITKFQKGI